MSNKMWRWGILSTANIGLSRFIPALKEMEGVEVVAIASRDFDKARKAAQQHDIPVAYGSYEELFSDPHIDIIYNPTPNHLHVPLSIQAMEHGKHVLCEKPIAVTVGELEQLIQAQKNTPSARVMEAFMYRFHPQWAYVMDQLHAGVIGRVNHVNAMFSYFNDDPNNVRNQATIGGGALLDIGCYCVDVSKMIFGGHPTSVQSHVEYDPAFETDRLTTGLLAYDKGTASVVCATQTYGFQQVCIHGTEGRIEVDIPFNSKSDEDPRKIRIIGDEGVEEFIFEGHNAYALMAQAMQDALEQGTELPISLEDSKETLGVMDELFNPSNDESLGTNS